MKPPPDMLVPADGDEKIPSNWRELHTCRGKLDALGRCMFCQWNAPDGAFGRRGMEAIPFDVPGVYDPKGEPHLLFRKQKLFS
jgi:hypothetical protein